MLGELRGAMNDDSFIYLFLDRASYHRNKDEIKPEMKKLNIIPVFNVAYRFEFNAIERLWGLYKRNFRAILLDKMLKDPGPNDEPLKQTLNEIFVMTEVKEPIRKFIKKA